MDQDTAWFIAGIAGLILYLFWSAWTEMGTKNPWRRRD
jgi:hypothetical protein